LFSEPWMYRLKESSPYSESTSLQHFYWRCKKKSYFSTIFSLYCYLFDSSWRSIMCIRRVHFIGLLIT
jgi:hypothetical protein